MSNPIRTYSELPRNVQNGLKNLEIELQFGCLGHYEHDTIKNIDQSSIQINFSGELLLYPILKYLRDLGYPVANSMISYLSRERNLYIYLGHDPLPSDLAIPIADVHDFPILQLKSRLTNQTEVIISANIIEEDNNSEKGQGSRRTKERKIGFIIDKVAKWRNLYNGAPNSNGEIVRHTLEEAALQVGISKKSLDDYLLQLRFGRKFGFNFEEHKNDKVGLLRAYVKKFKFIQSEIAKLQTGEVLSKEILEMLNQKGTPSCKSKKCCVPPSGMLKLPVQFVSSSVDFGFK
ncbi:unnamed protein product [Blepharisma stoltei]|uniref:Uncharacterized protein n=1 Tax=Blepharisma stoltei TaxID=1481888 RepID=A0AAU9IT85_9CILI|nr:unnamed protein product [Blepharisma stoltei]